MREFQYENQGSSTYLVYKVNNDEIIDTLSMGMLINNNIPGLASAIRLHVNGEECLKYNISSKITVSQLLLGVVNKKRLLGVFNGILDAMLSTEEYMIDPSMIIIDTDYMFTDVSSCETVLVCLPIVNSVQQVDVSNLLKTIMFNTQFDQTENCSHVAKIINYLNSVPVFSLLDFKKLLVEITNENTDQGPKNSVLQNSEPDSSTVSQARLPTEVLSSTPTAYEPAKRVNMPSQVLSDLKEPVQKKPFKGIEEERGATLNPISEQGSDSKEITLLYLLQHYNSENAAAYKAQKAAKKKKQPKKTKDKQEKTQEISQNLPNDDGRKIIPEPAKRELPIASTQIPGINSRSINTPRIDTKQSGEAAHSVSSQQVQNNTVLYQGGIANFGNTTVLNDSNKIGVTTVLGEIGKEREQKIKPHLVRMKNNERITLSKPVFRIGKERSYVDYFIGDNTAISRSHCNIVTRGSEFFVVDTNSTNHTFVNGGMIKSNEEVRLTHGTKLKLANEDFEFRLY